MVSTVDETSRGFSTFSTNVGQYQCRWPRPVAVMVASLNWKHSIRDPQGSEQGWEAVSAFTVHRRLLHDTIRSTIIDDAQQAQKEYGIDR